MKRTPDPVPDPENRPLGYRDPDVLQNLYAERGWRRIDIANHFDVSVSSVDHHIRKHDVARNVENSHPPNGNGLARKLYEIGMEEAQL